MKSIDDIYKGTIAKLDNPHFQALNRANVRRTGGVTNADLHRCGFVRFILPCLSASGIEQGSVNSTEHYCGVVESLAPSGELNRSGFCACRVAARRLGVILNLLKEDYDRDDDAGRGARELLRKAYLMSPQGHKEDTDAQILEWAEQSHSDLVTATSKLSPESCATLKEPFVGRPRP